MALTISNKSNIASVGNKFTVFADVAFDSSYLSGGEELLASTLGLVNIERLIIDPKNGFYFEYDYTNNKIQVMGPAPPIVFEETVTVTDDEGTLAYPAAYIMYVSTGNTAYKVIPGGLAAVTETVSVSEPVWGTRNTLSFLTADTVTTCKVTYVTQAWKDVFDNYVLATLAAGVRTTGHASLTFTAASPDVISLGELAVAIQSCMWDDNGTYKPMDALYKAETAATTEATIDFSDTTTKLAVLESDTMDASTDTVYIQYIKHPGSGTFLGDRFIEEDDLTPSSDIITVSSDSVFGNNMLLWGTCGDLPGPTTAFADIISSSESVSSTGTLSQPTTMMNDANTLTFGSGHADSTHHKLSYIAGLASDIPGLVPLEVKNGTVLTEVSGVKIQAIGY